MKKIVLLILICFCLFACSMHKQYIVVDTNEFKETVIHAAIKDFVKNSKLINYDSVFYVEYIDSAYITGYNMRQKRRYTPITYNSEDRIPNVSLVVILGSLSYSKFMVLSEDRTLPEKYVIMNGKLFYWIDDNFPKSQEIKESLLKYDMLYYDNKPSYVINAYGNQGSHYYFCNNDVRHFTSIEPKGIEGGFEAPKISCLAHSNNKIIEEDFPVTYQYSSYNITLFQDRTFEAKLTVGSLMLNNRDKSYKDNISIGKYNIIDSNCIELISQSNSKNEKEMDYSLTSSHMSSNDSIYLSTSLSKELMKRHVQPFKIEYIINNKSFIARKGRVVIPKASVKDDTTLISVELNIYPKYPLLYGKYCYHLKKCTVNVVDNNVYNFSLPLFTNAYLHRIYFNHFIIPLY